MGRNERRFCQSYHRHQETLNAKEANKKRTMSFFFQMIIVFSHSSMETKSISTAHTRVPYSRGVPSMQTIEEDGNTALIKVSMQPVLMREAPGFPDEGGKSIMSPGGKPWT